MKALVTGAGGFIGSHLVERLLADGHDVKAFVHYRHPSWMQGVDAEVIEGDIRDIDSFRPHIRDRDTIFHLAALIDIPYSYIAPQSYIRTNVEGTLNVLQAARDWSVKLIHTSSSEVYGTAQYVPMDENHPLHAQSPYAASKIAADQMVQAFHLSYNLPTVIVRPFNTYGPRQSERAVIPHIISQNMRQGKVWLGDRTPKRDFTHVTDTVDGFIKAATADAAIGEVINLGAGVSITIEVLEQMLTNKWGALDTAAIRPQASEVMELCCNNKKAEKLLGWTPKVNLSHGLEETTNWMLEHANTAV